METCRSSSRAVVAYAFVPNTLEAEEARSLSVRGHPGIEELVPGHRAAKTVTQRNPMQGWRGEDAEKGGLYVLKVGVDWSGMVIKLPDRKVYTQLTVTSKRRISDAMWSLSLDTEQLPWVLQGPSL